MREFLDENLNGLALLHIQEPDTKLISLMREFFTCDDKTLQLCVRYLLATTEGIKELADEVAKITDEMGGEDALLPDRAKVLKDMYALGQQGEDKDKLAALKEYATLKGMYQVEEVADHLPNHVMLVHTSGDGSVEDWEEAAKKQQAKVMEDAARSERKEQEAGA